MKFFKLALIASLMPVMAISSNVANADETVESCRWFASKNPTATKKWSYLPPVAKDRIKRQCAAFGISLKY